MRPLPALIALPEALEAFDAAAAGLDDPRPHPPEAALRQLGDALMTEVLDLTLETALEDWLQPICESVIGGLHAAVLRIERDADRARDRLAEALRDFDGSEVADVDLQDARDRCRATDVAVQALERVRDAAAAAYTSATGETWSPWRGAVRKTPVSAAQLDARAALQARDARRATANDPGDWVVALRASPQAKAPEDAMRIFDALNWAHAQWPQMALAISDAPGGERIAKRWAAQKCVPVVLARPDFTRHGRSAPFRANDTLLAFHPVCVFTLSRSLVDAGAKPFGPVLNLIDQAQRANIRCVRIARKGAAASDAPMSQDLASADTA